MYSLSIIFPETDNKIGDSGPLGINTPHYGRKGTTLYLITKIIDIYVKQSSLWVREISGYPVNFTIFAGPD